MACGCPTIGANSGGPMEFVKPEQGVLIEEQKDWETKEGAMKLGARLADTVAPVEKFFSTNPTHVGPFVLCFQSSFRAVATVSARRAPSFMAPSLVSQSFCSSMSTPCSGFTNSTGPPLLAPIVGQPQAMHSMK